jgi:hypothetical protein
MALEMRELIMASLRRRLEQFFFVIYVAAIVVGTTMEAMSQLVTR